MAFLIVYLLRSIGQRKVVWPVRGGIGRTRALGYSLFGGVCYNLFISLALVTTSATIVGIVLTTEPVWIVFIDSSFKRRLPSRRLIASLVVAIASNVALLVGGSPSIKDANPGLGVIFATLAALSWGVFTVLSERWGAPAFDKSAQMALVSAPVALFVPLIFGGSHPKHIQLANLGEIAIVSLGSNLVAMVSWIRGVGSGGSQFAALFLYLQPIATIGLSAIFLHQSISLLTVVCLILVIASVINVTRG